MTNIDFIESGYSPTNNYNKIQRIINPIPKSVYNKQIKTFGKRIIKDDILNKKLLRRIK